MRTFKLIILALMMYTVNAFAQDEPTTPKTPNDMQTEVTSTVSNSTSTSNSDNTYKLTSKFQSSKRKGVLDILVNELNDIQVRKKGNQYVWSTSKNGKTIFECELSNNKLKMLLDKDESSYSFNRKIKSLGKDLVQYISAHKSFSYATTSNSVGDAQVRVQKAKEELQRSLKNLEKTKRNH
jgi:hypothetical protein